ncbi:MAG: hypothetical protein KGS61_17770, partial [Verrucomicrobia bacterium]|nr:hypothetical protein [Verrucomicrobiota bacterium]
QTSGAAPVLSGSTPYVFDAGASLSASNVASGSVTLPNSTVKTFTADGQELRIKESYATVSALAAADPYGTYTVTLNTVDNGTKTIALALSATVPFPTTPQISNFTAAQAIDSAAPFTLTWSPFSNGTSADYISVEIDDAMGNTVLNSADIGMAGALNGTATSFVIPANQLQAGQSYSGRLMFVKGTALDTNSYPGAVAVAGFYKQTQFTLATAGGTASGPDVQTYLVAKGQQFFQSSTNPPAPRPDAPFVFNCFVNATDTGDVANASVQVPGGSSETLAGQTNDRFFQFINGFATQDALDTNYPVGSYTLSINTVHHGLQQSTLTLSAANYPGTVPALTDFAAAQSINPTADFVLSWNAFGGGTTSDFVQLSIQDSNGNTVFNTPQPGTPGASNGLTLSVLIPRGTLVFGQTYFGNLVFARGVIDTNSVPGATGLAGYFIATAFNLATEGITPPTLSLPTRLPGGAFQFQLTGLAAFTYEVDFSTNLTGWAPLTNVTTDASGAAVVVDPLGVGSTARFYRASFGGSSSAAMFDLFFDELANAGTFGVNASPQIVFPVPLNSYRATLAVHDEFMPPPAASVTFTGPAGSGLANTPADYQSLGSPGSVTYGSPAVSNPAAAPGGTWVINYNGATQSIVMPDPQANSRLVIPVPTVTVANGALQLVAWAYRSASGSSLGGPPSFLTNIQIQVSDSTGARLYSSPTLSPSNSSFTFPTSPTLTWSGVGSIALAYADDLGNNYVVFFQH